MVEKKERERPAAPDPSPARPDGAAPPGNAVEQGDPKDLDPTRYNDWEKGGRCIDF